MNTPTEFPRVICWDVASRAEVMNTMALDVRPEVFAATHYPSLVLDNHTQSRISEEEYLGSFLHSGEPHVLDAAIGDSGVGKSHFVRWLYNRITNDPSKRSGLCVMMIPRSSANLADVLRELIKEFAGDAVDRVRRELELSQNRATTRGAANRVLDEYAFVLDPANHDGPGTAVPPTVDVELYREIRETLPAMLRDQAIRDWLTASSTGIVSTLARHVCSRRDNRDELRDIALRLTWHESDLEIDAGVVDRAGEAAGGLAGSLLADDAARSLAVRILNDAFSEVSNGLLGLRRGDLGRAILDIRRQLRSQGRELVLLIEDMSVAHGLDRDLLEALIVRTRDAGGEEACKLRAVIGLTTDDYSRLPDNIKGRIRRTLSFNLRFAGIAQAEGAEVGREEIIDFASRYLNAVRYGIARLQKWAATSGGQDLESFCDATRCPNVDRCQRAFGHVKGRSLYPFTGHTLIRLYSHAPTHGSGTTARNDGAFNPRIMVADVLNEVLAESERSIPSGAFPPRSIAETFRLDSAGAAVSDRLQQLYRNQPGTADRVLTAIELYAQRPVEGKLPPFIAEAFDLPATVGAEHPLPPEPPSNPPDDPVPQPSPIRQQDEFDRWVGGTGNNLAQNYLNEWRGYVYDAVAGYIDWDQPGLASLSGHFMRQYINFDGQIPNRKTGGVVVLELPRSPQVALALRGLKTHFAGTTEAERHRMVDLVAYFVREWAKEVLAQLGRLKPDAMQIDPRIVAAEYLAMGAMLRGELPPNANDSQALAATFRQWPAGEVTSGSSEWMNLWRAYRDHADKVRDLLRRSLACSKGAQAGDFIDPTPILEAIRRVRALGMASPLPADAENWPMHYDPVKRLANAVQRCVSDASDRERQNADQWLRAVDALIGGDDFVDVCKRIRKSAEAAASVDAFGSDGAQSLSSECQRLAQRSGKFADCSDSARRAVDAAEPGLRLRALALLDREFMTEVLMFLQKSFQSLSDAASRLDNHGSSSQSIEQYQRSIGQQIGALRTDLVELQEAGNDLEA